MDFRVRWTLPAADDFESLARQIEEDSDFIESQKTVRRILESIEGLLIHPHRGQKLEDYPQLRRLVVPGFNIFYQVFEGEKVIEMTRILHQRQNLPDHIG